MVFTCPASTIGFIIHPADLASFDTQRSSWVADPGKYTIKMGASSFDIRQTGNFNLSKEIVVEKCNRVLTPQVTIDEFTGK